ncbi:hypothetical protein ACWD0G_26985, partial [Streptomyces goshikiensis]
MSDPRAPEDDDYSATVLGSHWISGPPEQPAETKRFDTPHAVSGAVPDRVEGSLLRFGPGVTARPPGTPFPVDVAAAPRRRRGAALRRYALAAVVLAAVLAYLGWARL